MRVSELFFLCSLAKDQYPFHSRPDRLVNSPRRLPANQRHQSMQCRLVQTRCRIVLANGCPHPAAALPPPFPPPPIAHAHFVSHPTHPRPPAAGSLREIGYQSFCNFVCNLKFMKHIPFDSKDAGKCGCKCTVKI